MFDKEAQWWRIFSPFKETIERNVKFLVKYKIKSMANIMKFMKRIL